MFYEDMKQTTDIMNDVDDKMLIELDNRSKIIFGENNSAEYSTDALGDPRLALSFKLVHNMDDKDLRTHIDNIYSAIKKTKNPTMMIDLMKKRSSPTCRAMYCGFRSLVK